MRQYERNLSMVTANVYNFFTVIYVNNKTESIDTKNYLSKGNKVMSWRAIAFGYIDDILHFVKIEIKLKDPWKV